MKNPEFEHLEQNRLLVKGMISDLPADQQEVAKEVADHIHRVVKQAGAVGLLAMSLVGLELQIEATPKEVQP